MNELNMPFFEAMSYTRKRRPIIFPNYGFQRQLMDFERVLKARKSAGVGSSGSITYEITKVFLKESSTVNTREGIASTEKNKQSICRKQCET